MALIYRIDINFTQRISQVRSNTFESNNWFMRKVNGKIVNIRKVVNSSILILADDIIFMT